MLGGNGKWGEGVTASFSRHDPKSDPCKRHLKTEERGRCKGKSAEAEGRAWEFQGTASVSRRL